MAIRLVETVGRWCDLVGVEASARPDPATLVDGLGSAEAACRPPQSRSALLSWERRHGYCLPEGLRAWLGLSNGLFRGGPLIHPLSAIGPMIPFATTPGLVVQPESWFEVGNPNVETICLDLAYRWPGGGHPVFTSGDDLRGTAPRLIAAGFEAWFLRLLRAGGREYWFGPDADDLGDPWVAHRAHVPPPRLPGRLRPFAAAVLPLMRSGAEDREIAGRLGLSRGDVEAVFRHLQHAPPAPSEVAAGRAV